MMNMNTKKENSTTASASQNCAIAKDAALTGLPTLDPNDMPTPAQRKKWRDEYRKAQDGALKLVAAVNTATAAPETWKDDRLSVSIEDARRAVQYKAHADKLAEALRGILAAYKAVREKSLRIVALVDACHEALAAYEEGKL